MSPDFPALWEKMCQSSFEMYESYLGLAGNPVHVVGRDDGSGAGSHLLSTKYASRKSSIAFNIASYSRQLLNECFVEGSKFENAEFYAPADLSRIPQKVALNATGDGAQALWKDESIVPVRGQIAWLIPQPELNYGVQYKNVNLLARRDGIVVQAAVRARWKGTTTQTSSRIGRRPRQW